jgi:arsenical pump membrane protein
LYASPTGDTARIALIGVVSAMGSAVLNNHPMAILNALAIQGTGAWTHQQVLAALIGGDLGPRLLPMGSLAGLLWFDSLRRLDVHPGLVRFVRIGVAVTVPALAVSLAVVLLSPP